MESKPKLGSPAVFKPGSSGLKPTAPVPSASSPPAPPTAPASEEALLQDAIPIEDLEEAEGVEEVSGTPMPEGGSAHPEVEAIDLADSDEEHTPREIKMFGPRTRQERKWTRTPNATGTGATHVKTFVAKLRLDAIEHLDAQINEWLDQHPEFEVKFVSTAVGELKGKITESAMFLTVWV